MCVHDNMSHSDMLVLIGVLLVVFGQQWSSMAQRNNLDTLVSRIHFLLVWLCTWNLLICKDVKQFVCTNIRVLIIIFLPMCERIIM